MLRLASARTSALLVRGSRAQYFLRLPVPTCTAIAQQTRGKKRLSRKAQRQRDYQLRINERAKKQARLRSMQNLHPAAKMKRILSHVENWFSDSHLSDNPSAVQEIYDYDGWVRISTLAKLDQFEHWADTNLVYNALADPSVERRYEVIVCRGFVEAVERNRVRRQRRQKEEAELEGKRQKQKREQRMEELEDEMEEMRSKLYLPLYKQDRLEELEYELEQEEKERQEEKKCLQEEWDNMTLLERAKTQMESAKEWIASKISTDITPEMTVEERKKEIEALTEDDVDLDDWGMFYEYEESLEYYELYRELEQLKHEVEDEWNNDDWEWRLERQFGGLERKFEAEKNLEEAMYLEALGIDKDKIEGTEDEELPPIEDDGSDLLMHALVRHKRVDLRYLSNLLYRGDNYSEGDEMDEWDDMSLEDYGGDFAAYMDGLDLSLMDESKAKKKQTKKVSGKPRYKYNRELVVIRKPEQLPPFIQKLRASIEKSPLQALGSQPFQAIGFDVEYCTLEMDIRNTLPAMLQLASPEPEGPVGLIWLDKFPNHGRDMIGDPRCKALLDLLSLSTIEKVGPSASNDAKHLASWWGIADTNYVDYFFAGMLDLEKDVDERVQGQTLQQMCLNVLERELKKDKLNKKEKDKKKKGKKTKTSHWRRDALTKEMKKYAADDAACAIDIWRKLQQERGVEIN